MQAEFSSAQANSAETAATTPTDVQVTATAEGERQEGTPATTVSSADDPRLIVLQALSEGRISLDQADKLLHSLDS